MICTPVVVAGCALQWQVTCQEYTGPYLGTVLDEAGGNLET